ncbi:Cold shock domain-containing protein C2 [Anabarilius grahami]|uniref:Cold shock domain-containing protein C2 n=1 Tax=Anabarilius grahami TaxID=495550 RepID=A0A3N0Y0X7_ANAGA|nr:Cold shock domain-containing protein C2 [Anabarilius grahami]
MCEFSVSPTAGRLLEKHLEVREQTDLIMAEPELSSPVDPSLRSPRSAPLSLSFPFLREGSRVWERAVLQPGELPSPLPTKRTRTYSATVRANAGPVFKGVCKNFSRSQGHGYIRPAHGGEDIFVHISE